MYGALFIKRKIGFKHQLFPIQIVKAKIYEEEIEKGLQISKM